LPLLHDLQRTGCSSQETPVPERRSDRDTDAELVQRDARVAADLQEPVRVVA
jgi:hypothetical protein